MKFKNGFYKLPVINSSQKSSYVLQALHPSFRSQSLEISWLFHKHLTDEEGS